jgi:hypothetical protein
MTQRAKAGGIRAEKTTLDGKRAERTKADGTRAEINEADDQWAELKMPIVLQKGRRKKQMPF